MADHGVLCVFCVLYCLEAGCGDDAGSLKWKARRAERVKHASLSGKTRAFYAQAYAEI